MDPVALILALLSGVAGVVLGSLIAIAREQQTQDRLDRAAARVTYFELAENTSYLTTAITNAVTLPVVTSVWPETRARLATLLSPGDFAIVATAYLKLTATATAWAMRLPGSPRSADGVAATRQVFERVEAAAATLFPHSLARDVAE